MKKLLSFILVAVMLLSAVAATFTVSAGNTGWFQDAKGWYYLNDGTRLNYTWGYDKNGTCLLDKDGYWVTAPGWKYAQVYSFEGTNLISYWFYIQKNGYLLTDSWLEYNGEWYYFDDLGIMTSSGSITYKNKCYLFDSDGKWVQKQGWYKFYNWYYVKADGTLRTDGWVKDSKGWMYFTDYGAIIASDTYHCGSAGFKTFYAFDKNGYWISKPGWQFTGEDWVYVKKDGTLTCGTWMKDSKGWCFLNDWGTMAKDQPVQDSKGYCYVDKSGYWVTKEGWVANVYDNYGHPIYTWYYVGKDGYLVTNSWKKDSKGWCHLGESGIMETNAIVADSHGLCYVDESGYWYNPGKETMFESGIYNENGRITLCVKKDGYLLTSGYHDEYVLSTLKPVSGGYTVTRRQYTFDENGYLTGGYGQSTVTITNAEYAELFGKG